MAIGDLNVRLGLQVRKFNREMRGVEFRLNRFARNTERIGQSFSQNLSLPIVAAGVAGIKMASDFEFSMTKITSQVGIAADEVKLMRGEVLKLSGETAQAPKDLAEAMFFVTSAGLRGTKALQATEYAAKGAATGYGETKVVADLLTSSMNAYASSNLTAEQSMDVLAATVREGKAEATELTAAMGQALPQATAMGIKFSELGGAIAGMTRTGTPAAQAVTQIKSIMMTFQKPSLEAEKIVSKLGTTFQELRERIKSEGLLNVLADLRKKLAENGIEAAEFFRKSEALNGVLDLTGDGLETNIGIMQRMADTTGTANKAFEEAAQTSQFKFKKALAELQVAGIDLGNNLLPMATKLAGKVTDLVKAFTGLDDSTKKTIVNTALVVAAVGPAITVFSKLILVYKNVRLATAGVIEGLRLAKIAFATTVAQAGAGNVAMVNFTTVLKGAKNAFMAFNAVSKAATIGLVIAAVAGAIAIFKKFNDQLSTTEKISKSANESIAGQRKEVELLTGIIQNETSTLEEKEKALAALQKISADYYGQLKLEQGQVEGLTLANNRYIESILSAAKAKAARDEIEKLAQEYLKLENQLKAQADEGIGKKIFVEGLLGVKGYGAAVVATSNKMADLKKQMEALAKTTFIDGPGSSNTASSGGGSGSAGGLGGASDTLKTKTAGLSDMELKGATINSEILAIYTKRLQEAGIATDFVSTSTDRLAGLMENYTGPTNTAIETTKRLSDTMRGVLDLSGEMATNMANAMAAAAQGGETSLKSLAKTALSAAKDIIGAFIRQGVAAAISGALKLPFPFNIAAATGAGALAQGIFNKAISSISIPGFADGVNNFAGGMAMVGERGPEMVTLPRGSNVTPHSRLNSMKGGGGSETLTAKISGNDLLLLLDRTRYKQGRTGL